MSSEYESAVENVQGATSLTAYEQALGPLNVTPGWIRREAPILPAKKKSQFVPVAWSYEVMRNALDAASLLIDVAQAERRNLILRNPIPANEWATSRTLVCAYQLILPGETAPSHRHASNALRVIIDGKGSYSVVNGDKMPMETGDVVLTPGTHWHGHGLSGDRPAYWLDCLDIPLSHLLESLYFQHHPDGYEKIARVVEDSPFRFSRSGIARALDDATADPQGRHGPSAILPTPSMPATGLVVQRLPSGMVTRRRCTAANRIFSVMAGSGTTSVDGQTFHWALGDTIVVPSNTWFQHVSLGDAQVLEMSDEPLLRFANHFYEKLD